MIIGTDLRKPVITPPTSEKIKVMGKINAKYAQNPGNEFIFKNTSATSLCINPKKKKIKKTPTTPPA